MIKTIKKMICDICSGEVDFDSRDLNNEKIKAEAIRQGWAIQEWNNEKIKAEAIKQGWLIDFPNGSNELLDICPECRNRIATLATRKQESE